LRLLPFLESGYQDFTIFYTAGQMVRSGQSTALYDLATQRRVQKQFATGLLPPYNHPPFEALLFVPLTYLGYVPAYAIWTAINVVLLGATLILLKRHFAAVGTTPTVLLVLATTGFFPIAGALMEGQDSMLLLAISATSMVLLIRKHDVASGGVLALGLFKLQIVFPMALVVALRRHRTLYGFAPIAIALAGLSVAMIGGHGIGDYLGLLNRLEETGGGGAIVVPDMPNLRGLVHNFPGTSAGGRLSLFVTILCSVALFLVTLTRVKIEGTPIPFTFSLAVVTAVLVSYHLYAYDLSLLLPVVLILFAESFERDIGLLVLLYTTPYALVLFQFHHMGRYTPVLLLLYWKLSRTMKWRGWATSS